MGRSFSSRCATHATMHVVRRLAGEWAVKVAEASPAPAEPAAEPVAVAQVEPAPAAVAEVQSPAPAPEPAPAPVVEESRVAAQAQSEPRAVGTSGQSELPRTASPLMLSGLLGLLSLASAAGLRLSRG